LTGLGSAISTAQESPEAKRLNVGFVGIGARGSNLFKILLELEGVEFRALCDIREDKVSHAQRWLKEAGRPEPAGADWQDGPV
jgi:hypothetical protein